MVPKVLAAGSSAATGEQAVAKTIVAVMILLLWAGAALAMGVGDSEGPVSIPEPQQDYRVRLTDLQGVRVELTQFAIAGQSFLLARRGEGEVAVPLGNVKEAMVSQSQGKLHVQATLASGQKVEFTADGSLQATGKTDYGNYRIPLKEVTRIEVLGPAR